MSSAAAIDPGAHPRKRARHSRTTTGCLTCREHKKKCDEQSPICKRCRTNDRCCKWDERASSLRPEQSWTRTSLSDTSSTPTKEPDSSLLQSVGDDVTTSAPGHAHEISPIQSTIDQTDHYPPVHSDAQDVNVDTNQGGFQHGQVQHGQVEDTFDWSQLESQFDTASFESLLSTTFSGTLWTPADNVQGVEPSIPLPGLDMPIMSSTYRSEDTSQRYFSQGQNNVLPHSQHHNLVVNSYTPVQVFLPPMYTAPIGAVSLPDTTDEGLLHYFMTVASKTWSALDSFGSPSSMMLLPPPVNTSSSSSGQALHGALLHAMLCASATHSNNLARLSAEQTSYGQQAKKHRLEAFRLLNASVSASDAGRNDMSATSKAESRVATVMLLILSSVFDGDAKTVPTLLRNARLEFPFCTKSNNVTCYIYSILGGLSRQKTINTETLSWKLCEQDPAWLIRVQRMVMMIMGTTQESLIELAKVHDLVTEHRSLEQTTSTSNTAWRLAEIEGQLDFIEDQLQGEDTRSTSLPTEGAVGSHVTRVQCGNRLFRTTARLYALRTAFGASPDDARIENGVQTILTDAESVVYGTEVGLSWPLILAGCGLPTSQQQRMLAIVKRCQWKNSASTRYVEQVLRASWKKSIGWETSMRQLGYPLIL